jgi:hypothetical protein
MEIVDKSAIPADAPKEQVLALFRCGVGVDKIASALGIEEGIAKLIIEKEGNSNGVVHGNVVFTDGELAQLKVNAIRLALNGENDGIRAKMTQWILSQAIISNETRYKAEKGIASAGNNINNIMIAIQTAKEKAASHG